MGREPIPKLLAAFALPATVGMMVNALYNVVDRIFVGRFVGPDGLAATSLCFPFIMLIFSLCLLFGVGASTLISTALGEKDAERAERILGGMTLSVFVLFCAVAIASAVFIDPLLRVSGAEGRLMPPAREYLGISILGMPLSCLAYTLSSCIRAEGRPSFAMATQVLGAASNIALDALFIPVLGMGVVGAAWGTVISQAVSALWVFSFYARRAGVLRFRFALPRPSDLFRITAIGLSPFLNNLVYSFFSVMLNRALFFHGGPLAVSALGAFMGWDSLLFLPVVGLGEAAQTLFAYNNGARLMARVLDILKLSLIIASLYFAASVLSVYFWAEGMLMLFTSDPELLEVAAHGMRISYAGGIFVGTLVIIISFFQGLGRAGTCLFMNITRQFLFLIPSVLLLPKYFGLQGVWLCFPAMDIGGAAVGLVLLVREYGKMGLSEFERI
jgi:putative MATE family efflux protein